MSGRRVVFAAEVVGFALLAAGCGGGSNAASVASLGTTSATSTSSSGGGGSTGSGSTPGGPAVVFSACIRAHGVPNFPDPSPGRSISPGAFNPKSLRSAINECVKLMPQVAPPALVPHKLGPLLAYARCMRKGGVPGFPDPDSQGHFPASIRQIDTNSPRFQAAIKTCRPLADGEPLSD